MLFPRNGGVYSGPRKAFAAASPAGNRRAVREPVEDILYASGNWRAPDTFAGIVRLEGRGQEGYPGGSYYVQQWHLQIVFYDTHKNGTVTTTYGGTQDGSGPTPASSCINQPVDPNGDYASSQACYEYSDTSYEEYYEPSQGAASGAFGAIFPGGYGGPATAVARDPVTNVQAGGQYFIEVAQGGYVRIAYYK